MSVATATVKAKAPRVPKLPQALQHGPSSIYLKLPITPAEAWAMVTALKISIEWYAGQYIATYRDRESNTYLPVPGETAFMAVVELLAQLGVEVAHG